MSTSTCWIQIQSKQHTKSMLRKRAIFIESKMTKQFSLNNCVSKIALPKTNNNNNNKNDDDTFYEVKYYSTTYSRLFRFDSIINRMFFCVVHFYSVYIHKRYPYHFPVTQNRHDFPLSCNFHFPFRVSFTERTENKWLRPVQK